MNKEYKVVVVMARCQKTQESFGIRIERTSLRDWSATWAFTVKAVQAKKEGYDKGIINGTFTFADNYPGCPYCQSPSLFKCSCGKAGCCGAEARKVKCPWCSEISVLDGIATSFESGSDA